MYSKSPPLLVGSPARPASGAARPTKPIGGARPHMWRGPLPIRLQNSCTRAAAQSVPRGPNRTPRRLPRPGEVIGCLGFLSLSLGTPQTRGAAAPVHRLRATAPRQGRRDPPGRPAAPGPLRGTPARCSPLLLLERRSATRGTGTSRGRPV
ncbi:hypothetical protein NDU88_001080 [Pleurodeles waltl]|uniref:Uncharacterized protein n=1 Tax=Pleurodeles waltl TaxID=8319 RepID=A0AAV7VZF0_PLEWA|nr:hypothetical protein NDU88_001080 [Pleurodeles waltl]